MDNLQLKALAEEAIAQSVFPGCVIGVIDRNGDRQIFSFGSPTYDGPEVVKDDSIYDCASITKSVPTALLALKLIDAGEISLDDHVSRYLEGYQQESAPQVLVKHLLTHTVDYRFSLASWKDALPIEIVEKLFIHKFQLPPGETFCYCNASSIILGMLLEKVYGARLEDVAQREIFDPLEMNESGFLPLDRFDKNRIVPSEDDPWRGRIIQGEVHDESAARLRELFVAGSAGLFSTAPDLLNPLEMILSKGYFRGKQFLSERIIQSIYTNQIQHLGLFTGLGFELNQPRYMGKNHTRVTFGKTGFTGCNLLGDVAKGKALVILSNFTWPKRKENPDRINQFRGAVADLLL